jgi:molybdopterin converting factor small subunit
MVQHFQKMGVTDKQIFAVVGKENIEEIGLDELAALKGLATAIKDGDVTVDDAFSAGNGHSEDLKSKTQAAADALKQKLGKTEPEQTPAAAEETTTTQATTDSEPVSSETELSSKDKVSQIVYQLQKEHGVKAKDLEEFIPEGVKKFSDLTEGQAADVLPTVQQLLESKQAG